MALKNISLQLKSEYVLIFIFSLSIFISKAGLNISLALSLIIMLTKTINQSEFRYFIKTNLIAKLSIICFSVGLIANLLSPMHLKGAGHFFAKAGFLLIFPLLIFIFSNQKIRKIAIISMLGGFVVAIIYSLTIFLSMEHWIGQRIGSFWTVGRWAELLSYMSILCVIFLTNRKNSKIQKLILTCILGLSIFCIALNGSRAAFLVLGLVIPVFILLHSKRLILPMILFSCIAISSVYVLYPDVVKQAEDRILSIKDLDKNTSNSSRLASWKEGVLFQINTIENTPITYITGYGIDGFSEPLKKFLIDKGIFQHLLDYTENQFSYRDHHNGLLNIISTSGIIYSTLFLYLVFTIYKTIHIHDYEPWLMFCKFLIITFILISIFYTNFMDFQTIGVFFMLAIGLGIVVEKENNFVNNKNC
ncbi:O-antigen ligase family protein [Vibrio vulnificus]|nr:O-antigen ligase family protein [Vibrio vulnificus]EJC6744758.1 O-antigen ligase family protein [Vibrio vulnificus]EJC6821097.1 O-antigen ligase family protein [Vibrio vulnificus]EJC6953742.1 O-antigen ligase family protein [Vibrio vulnificus]EJC6959286.1 O-antigen ligase family protein [Vibrio vulnificus]